MKNSWLLLLAGLLWLPGLSPLLAAEPPQPVTVAVAANFRPAAEALSDAFTAASGKAVRLVSGSTGALYAQISNGAPFDVFLAADAERPRQLEEAGFLLAGSRFTYARGQLMLWSADARYIEQGCSQAIENESFRRLALASPEVAPYGRAAREYLRSLGAWERVQDKLAFGENAIQAMQFVATGNADLGLVPVSLAASPLLPEATCAEPLEPTRYPAIEQQGGLVERPQLNPAAADFLGFIRSDAGQEIIRQSGYLPLSAAG